MTDAPELHRLSAAIVVVDAGRVVQANPAAAALLRLDEAALVGRALESLLGEDDLSRVLDAWSRGDTGVLRVRFLEPGGGDRPVQIRTSVLPDGRRVLAARDVSALVRAENLVAALGRLPHETRADPEGLLEAAAPIFNALGWALAVVRTDGGHFEVTRLLPPDSSPAFARVAAGLEGLRVPMADATLLAHMVDRRDAVLLEDAPGLLARLPGAFGPLGPTLSQDGLSDAIVAPMRRGGALEGGLLVIARALSPWDVVAVELFAGILSAAGALQALERELVERERLATVGAVAAELGDVVARTLDQVARTTWGLAAPEGDPTAARLLEILAEESARLTRLAHELMAFARPLDPRRQSAEPARLVEAAVGWARKAVGGDAAAPRVVLAPELPEVRVDPLLAAQGLAHVVENALEHAPEEVSVEAEATGAGVRVTVRNGGPGIPLEDADRLFEPFFTTKAMGTGLGLALARRMVEEAGGTLALASAIPPVAFTVDLPRAEGAVPRGGKP